MTKDNEKLEHKTKLTDKALAREKDARVRHQGSSVVDRNRSTAEKNTLATHHNLAENTLKK